MGRLTAVRYGVRPARPRCYLDLAKLNAAAAARHSVVVVLPGPSVRAAAFCQFPGN